MLTSKRTVVALLTLALLGPAIAQDVPADLAPLKPRPAEKSQFPGYTPATINAKGGEFVLPLRASEWWGQGGPRMVTSGVPLLPGQAADVSALRLAVKDGEGNLAPVPAQFRELARWWRADNSLRWVLVDTQTSVDESQVKTFYLTNKKLDPAAPKQPVSVEQTDDAIVVTTGPARFAISRTNFNLFTSVRMDANKDGQFGDDEELLDAAGTEGLVLEDTEGNTYHASAGTSDVRVIESGPMRVRVRARGRNVDAEGKGYSKGMYQFDVMLDFFAGSCDVRADVVIGNNSAEGIGTPTFADASLIVKLADGGKEYRLYGEAPLDGSLAGQASVMLYQDSNGAETWRQAQGHYAGDTSTFRGYKMLFRTPAGNQRAIHKNHGGYGVWDIQDVGKADAEQEMTQGGQARGTAQLMNDRGGLVVHTPYFWEQFPKGVELFADGRARLALFPREYKANHWLEDAAGKGHEVILQFYNRKVPTGYAARGGHTWPHVMADCWDYPVFLMPSAEHKQAAGALTDVGPYTAPTRGFETWPLEVHYRRMLMTDRYWGNGFGWQMFGSRWQAHGGHSTRGARQPIKEDAWLYKFYTIEDRNWWVYGEARSRHFRDVRSYRIEGQDPFGFEAWEDYRRNNRQEDYCNRKPATGPDYDKFTKGHWGRSTWWLPNPAHQTLDLVYDRYLLFGDQRALENMRIIAATGGYYAAYTGATIHRATGWSIRACNRYWELTGDAGAERVQAEIIKHYQHMIGNPPLVCGGGDKVNWWFTQVFSRGIAMTALTTRDPKALEFCKTMAVGKESRADYFCTLFAVLYHLTGEQKYKDAILKKTRDGETLLTVNTSGDFPATAHWLINQKPVK